MFRLRSKGVAKQNLPALGERVDACLIAQLTGMTRQHITRLCRGGNVPGAYQSKGGHWRFRWSQQLAVWVSQRMPDKLMPGELSQVRADKIHDEICACMELQQLIERRLKKLRRISAAIQPVPLGLFTDPSRGLLPLPQAPSSD